MAAKRKDASEERPYPDAQILADIKSRKVSKRALAIRESWDFAPYAGAVLAVLLRGLRDSDELVWTGAVKGLMRVFPSVEVPISRLAAGIDDDNPKVRLAVIDSMTRIVAEALAALSGIRPDKLSPIGKQAAPVMEDLMKYAGRWLAWTRDRQRLLAVADSFVDVMAQAKEAGEFEPYVRKAPGVSPETARKPFAILEGESPNILDDVKKMFPDPRVWLDTPNESLGGEKPRDLIDSERERDVRYLLRGIEDGITT